MNAERKDTLRGQLELKLGGQISALISASHALNVRTAAAFDSSIQPAAFHIVRWLYSYGPTSASVLAESTAMDRSSVSRLIKQLENLGYVRREDSPNDRRAILLTLTELGRQKTFDALQDKEFIFYERIAQWDNQQLETFIQMLQEFNGFNDN
ncbi:MarR family transcriptional regulator [Paenibacillus odorifer]|jgi:DNA-binding MarR family transcriptional regulator|uniref:MarR family winged helix-turn-helix transcriptional regulator n=1 Tax=Paenibacillus TaxID=44249 RepID=UPI00096BF8F8|nr:MULTISPECIES: MarR family transcriptional regulator [Paenibacillus]MDH6426304.1 DNA-binding MarR family transcriptional regulator [Paenibacillus sp. PastH-4]MDH6442327.1 DNA-binding MarR family transcriptional regulator [Paenibacillus sp. PastF-4]MDH6526960.1 DNA-binding MarR family transcriptional regulator [Paenibacillus sp. PastH-3]OMD69567.1 MarR family transcriptional regulator [Paenibacillus odorifer]OMD80180.1 MarR family transcriptional regulator [Paenibacillus odorifer]